MGLFVPLSIRCFFFESLSYFKVILPFKVFFFFFSLGMSHTLFCFVLLIITGNVKHTQIEVHNEPP